MVDEALYFKHFIKAMEFYALIMAAGSGTRFSGDLPKQYHLINDLTVLDHTLNAFKAVIQDQNIVVVADKDHANYLNDTCKTSFENITIIHGSDSRNKSVHNGLKSLSKKLNKENKTCVLIHDGARCLIKPEDIKRVMTQLQKNQTSLSMARSVTDSLCMADKNHKIHSSVNRDKVYALETPQAFIFEDIWQVHQNAKQDHIQNFSDDTSLMRHYGYDVEIIENHAPNFKITYPHDLEIARSILNAK